jgi:hypothetical protein
LVFLWIIQQRWITGSNVTSDFINYRRVLHAALYYRVCQILHESSFRISGQNQTSELLWH